MGRWLSNPLMMLQQALIMLPAILFSLSMHEFAHALAADKQGDMTPRLQGRLTLNPAAHIDWMGLVMLLFAGFGWARPVRVNPNNYRNRKYGDLIVSLAGPMMNLLLAFIFSAVYSAIAVFMPWVSPYVMMIFGSFVTINCVLFAFNLIPLPPLDGFSILRPLLRRINWNLPSTLERYGSILLIVLLISGVTSGLISLVNQLVGDNFVAIFYRLFSAMR